MGVDGREVSLTNYGRTRDSGLRPVFDRSGITSYVFGGINEHDTLRITEDWIYNSERQEIEW